MNEVSDSSNTSAPETSTIERPAPAITLRPPVPQDASSGSNLLDDKILTAWRTDNGGNGVTVPGVATPAASGLRIADDAVPSLGSARDQGLTVTDSSASHLGDVLPPDAVAAPTGGDSPSSRPPSTSISFADHTMAANDVTEPPEPWHTAGSALHSDGASSHGANSGHDAGSLNPSQHAGHLLSSTLDILPLDDVIDPIPHHAAGDHHGAPANDAAKPAHADGVKIADAPKLDAASKPAGLPDHHDAPKAGTGPAPEDSAIHQAPAPSAGAMVEAGTKAILLASEGAPSRIGPHASAADLAPGAGPSHSPSAGDAAVPFSPGVLGARDQLASAIATATPEAAAMTTLPASQITGAVIPTLGSDMHALQKHAA